ncbi:uncharacterized protein LOC135216665 [Macrobrachium nipponense]|uniref:uncharacterized protein LOC135216665 n=1 Tax=Macrobrachium nipponense TaxID=159736 RepID=UPI0030C7AFE7
MIPKICLVIIAVLSTASAAPQVYRARGAHHPTAEKAGEYSRALAETVNILPELTSAFKKISENEGGSFPSDPTSIMNIVASFMPMTRQSILLRDALEGKPAASQDDLEKLQVFESALPAIVKFMETMRAMGGNLGSQNTPGESPSSNPTGELLLDTRGANDGMVEAVVEFLPEISKVFQQINSDPSLSNPNDPAFTNRVILAFMPLSKKAIEAQAKAEGRAVRPEELDRLNQVDVLMPAVMEFMKSLRIPTTAPGAMSLSPATGPVSNAAVVDQAPLGSRFDSPKPAVIREPAFPQFSAKPISSSSYDPAQSHAFPSPNPSAAFDTKPLNLPSRFETPEPTTFKQPAFPGQTSSASTSLASSAAKPVSSTSLRTSQPAVSTQYAYALPASGAYSAPLEAPSFPEVTHVVPPVYQAFIPTVPDTISGLPAYYSFSTVYGR